MLAVGLFMVAFSPWSIPQIDVPVEQRPRQVCREGVALAEVSTPPPSMAPQVRPQDNRRSAKIERGMSPRALIASGATLLAAGSLMKVWAPTFIEIDPTQDPWSGTPVKAGYSTGLPNALGGDPRTVVLGTVGTVLQAIGVGTLSRGLSRRQQ